MASSDVVSQFAQLGLEMIQRPVARSASKGGKRRNTLSHIIKNTTVNIDSISSDGWNIKIDVNNLPVCFLNSLRRTLLADVPSMAVMYAKRKTNISAIYDEILTARIAMVPLKANPYLFNFPDVPITENTFLGEKEESKISCYYTLNVKNTASTEDGDAIKLVLSKDIKVKLLPTQRAEGWKDEDFEPVYDDIVLNKLGPGHEVNFMLKALKGSGFDHASFQPASAIAIKRMPVYTFPDINKLQGPVVDRLLKFMPESERIFQIEQCGKEKKVVGVKPDMRYNDTGSRNFQRDPELCKLIHYQLDESRLTFSLESLGARSGIDLTLEAIDVMLARIKNKINQCERIDRIEQV